MKAKIMHSVGLLFACLLVCLSQQQFVSVVNTTTEPSSTDQSLPVLRNCTTARCPEFTSFHRARPATPIGACGQRSTNLGYLGPYIIGGQNALRGAWPWQVLLLSFGETNSGCGGSLISMSWVMTAAHCVLNHDGTPIAASNIRVKAGSVWGFNDGSNDDANTQTRYADQSIVHPLYNSQTDTYDIALLHFAIPFIYSDYVRPVCLPAASVDLSQFRTCAATGFGLTSYQSSTLPAQLQQISVTLLPISSCDEFDVDVYDSLELCITTSQCNGDSGGPVVCKDSTNKYYVVGVVSFTNTECQHAVDTKVSAFIPWITQTTTAGCFETLEPGEFLSPGSKICASQRVYELVYQTDGNLVIYKHNAQGTRPIWATMELHTTPYKAIMKEHGNFVVYKADRTEIWNTETSGNPNSYLIMQDDGNLVLYNSQNRPLWSSNTVGCVGTTLASGQYLYPDSSICAVQGVYKLIYQTDGNLVIYEHNAKSTKAIWATNTAGTTPYIAIMQTDGNFVVYTTSGRAIFATGTYGNPNSYLGMQDDGNLVLYNSHHWALWNSNTKKGCFPGHSTARTQDGQRVALSDLSLGDMILALDVSTGLPVYSEVIAFLNLQSSKYVPHNSSFIRIATEDGVTITSTPHHLIYVADSEQDISSAQARYAASVKPGDYIFSVYSGGENIRASKVLEVVAEICSGCGLYSPLTMAGTIVVDDAIASCYASISSHALADVAMTPIRLVHSIMTALHIPLNAFSSVIYSSTGAHIYPEFIKSIGRYLLPMDLWY